VTRWLIASALVALSCSSESSSRAARADDGGVSPDADNPSVPPGGSCDASAECEPVGRYETGCVEGVCTFACAGSASATAECKALGGECVFVAGVSNSCEW
jgi:hypothetical protein